MRANTAPKEYEYTRGELVRELANWAENGGRLYSIEAAISAVYWLERSTPDEGWRAVFALTLDQLRAWLNDDTPNIPDALGEATLHCLRHSIPASPARTKRKGEKSQ